MLRPGTGVDGTLRKVIRVLTKRVKKYESSFYVPHLHYGGGGRGCCPRYVSIQWWTKVSVTPSSKVCFRKISRLVVMRSVIQMSSGTLEEGPEDLFPQTKCNVSLSLALPWMASWDRHSSKGSPSTNNISRKNLPDTTLCTLMARFGCCLPGSDFPLSVLRTPVFTLLS